MVIIIIKPKFDGEYWSMFSGYH